MDRIRMHRLSASLERGGRNVARTCLWAIPALLIAACGGGGAGGGSIAPAPTLATATSTAAPALGLKNQIAGLADRKGFPQQPYVRSFVVLVPWATLQTSPGAPIIGNNPIDQALAQARAANALGGSAPPVRIKLRVLAGINAPDWAKNLDGPPMTICDDAGAQPVCGTVGRFWTANFGAAYAALEAQLAALYDAVPEILEVAVSRCSTVYAEPLLRQATLPANLAQYQSAGYTLAADQRCQHDQIDAHQVWRQTRSSFAFNPYDSITVPVGGGSATATVDEAYTESLTDYCRSSLAKRCVLGNNSINGAPTPVYAQMYAKIATLGPPIYFQTRQLNLIVDLPATLGWAVQHGAAMVELPVGYDASADGGASTIAPYDARLRANQVLGP